MTATDYINKGFRISAHLEQAIITRAEDDVKQAYLLPIVDESMLTDAVVKDALMNFTFLLLVQRSDFATRSGGKIKLTAESSNVLALEALQEQAFICHMKLEAVRSLENARKDAKVIDICKIYFKTNYFNL